jgi:hypothetical protein
MKKFVAVFLGSAESMEKWKALDEETRKKRERAGMEAWGKWMTDNKGSIVEGGGPLGKTKRIDRSGIADTKNEMAAYVVVHAESHEAAAKLFVNHAHFMIFPGESVEIMECLPIPQM